MVLSSDDFLKDFDQFAVKRDFKQGVWRILNTWHESIPSLDSDDDVPDDSPALTILSDAAVAALLKEVAKEWVLQKLLPNTLPTENDDVEEDLRAENKKLKEEIDALQEQEGQKSEPYLLKRHMIDAMLKLAGLEDVRVMPTG